jgi:hypothetical protein
MNEDGKYQQGPIPRLGGPFDTATEFFKAWAAANPKYPYQEETLRQASGQYADEVIPSVASFPKFINDIDCLSAITARFLSAMVTLATAILLSMINIASSA